MRTTEAPSFDCLSSIMELPSLVRHGANELWPAEKMSRLMKNLLMTNISGALMILTLAKQGSFATKKIAPEISIAALAGSLKLTRDEIFAFSSQWERHLFHVFPP